MKTLLLLSLLLAFLNPFQAGPPPKPFVEKVLINRIEYADGSIWQRKGWGLAEVKDSYERVLREQWVPGMCKAL